MNATEPATTDSSIGTLARRALRFELGIWRSLYRWVARRPRVQPGAAGFGYSNAVEPVIWVFIVVSAIEVVVVHLLLPWPPVRAMLLILGVWGLSWMVGMLASVKVNVHELSRDGLRARYGSNIDVFVPWSAVASVRPHRQDLPSSRAVQLSVGPQGTALSIGVPSQTNVRVILREPVAVTLPKGEQVIVELRCYADDAGAFVDSARSHLGQRPDTTG
ncbi:MAG TPA: hypothetical protein VFZ72_14110 [Jiangellaceae bacterium]